jgi:putative ABC transport system ATP-binding protein
MQLRIRNLLPTYFDESVCKTSEVWGKDLEFNKGELIKVVAPSGSGKSSLMNFLYGMRKEYAGDIFYGNLNFRQFSIEESAVHRKNHLSIVFQDLRLFPDQSARQNIEIKRQLNPYHPTGKIDEMAERLGIAGKLEARCGTCSYGEQQRIAIIRAMMQPFDILLLDEPFSHLDNNNSQKAMKLMLDEASAREATIIFADLERIDYFPFTRLYHL